MGSTTLIFIACPCTLSFQTKSVFRLFGHTQGFLSKNIISFTFSAKAQDLVMAYRDLSSGHSKCLMEVINIHQFCFILKTNSQLTRITGILNTLCYNTQQHTISVSKMRHDTSKVTLLNDKIFSLFLYSEIILKDQKNSICILSP